MVSAGFGVGGGIVAEDGETAQALADAAWRLAEEKGCTGLELRGGTLPEGPWHLNGEVYANFAADLPQGDEAILLSIKKRQRAEVRRAQGFGLTFTEGTGRPELDAHYLCYATSVRNHGTPIFPRALFQAMAAEFGDDAHILTAWKDGRPLSSLFTFFFKGSAMPFWGGGIAEAREWRANEATYYELMCRASRRGCTRFDLGRSKVGTGPYAFKKNWGFEPTPLVYATRTADGADAARDQPDEPQIPAAGRRLEAASPVARQHAGPADRPGARLMADILFLAHRIPYPPDRGDKIRSWHELQHLSRLARVHLACFADDEADAAHLPALREALNGRLGEAMVEIRQRGKAVAGARALIEAAPSRSPCSTASACALRPPAARDARTSARSSLSRGRWRSSCRRGARQRFVMDFGDIDSDKFAAICGRGRADGADPPPRGAHARSPSSGKVAARADVSLFVSDAEAALFREKVCLAGRGHPRDPERRRSPLSTIRPRPSRRAEAPHPLARLHRPDGLRAQYRCGRLVRARGAAEAARRALRHRRPQSVRRPFASSPASA